VSYDYSRTREQVAALVLKKLGIVAAGGTAKSADADDVYEAIDLRLKDLHRLGVVWRYVPTSPLSFTVTSGVNSASATADIQFPIAMFISDGSRDTPVDIINVKQYTAIHDKTETGLPTKALWHTGARFTLWPVPTATATAKLVYERFATDTTAGSAIDIDTSMVRWIRDIICYDVGENYGKSEQTINRYMLQSDRAEMNIRKLNAQRVDYAPVAVDDFCSNSRNETDYDTDTR